MTFGSKIQRIVTTLTAIGGGTVVLFTLVLSPCTISRLQLVFAKLRENSVLIPMFFSALGTLRREESVPLWILILCFPFIAMMVLLDDYA